MTDLHVQDRPALVPANAGRQLPIDPRIAARWISVRQEQHRRRWKYVVAAAAVVTLLVGAWLLARSPVLADRNVVLRGATHTTRDAVLSAAGLSRPRPMLDIDPSQIRRRLAALPWVAQVSVQRNWPRTVTITVEERVPVAELAGPAGQPALVDQSGRILAVGSEARRLLSERYSALPILHGLPLPGDPGTHLTPEGAGPLAVLQALVMPGSGLATVAGSRPSTGVTGAILTVTDVIRTADGAVSAILSPGAVTVRFGPPDNLAAKVMALRSVLTQVGPDAPATIDVEVASAPVLTNGKKGTSVSTTQRG